MILNLPLLGKRAVRNLITGKFTDNTVFIRTFYSDDEARSLIRTHKDDFVELSISARAGVFTNTDDLFSDMQNINNIDCDSLKTDEVISMERMFMNCPNLYYVYLGEWNVENVTSVKQMFKNCPNLRQHNIFVVDKYVQDHENVLSWRTGTDPL